MKPSPQHDFPVSVTRPSYGIEGGAACFYESIFEVTLNFTVSISFVPLFERSGREWPPRSTEDPGRVQSTAQARFNSVAMARYAVTPDDRMAGGEALIPALEADVDDGVVFYVESQEFEVMARELSELEDELSGVYDFRNVSKIEQLRFVQLLLRRVLTSPHFSTSHRRILGR